ncbi:unnamed protein product [Tuber aestivum]|uniref:Uncharacterized protein n=1 Tax=Tuber aestivum TaxID=59557 RepID=A0A292Q469_9PEZI|nr:unnamed protein product [Tuber aestivum]
MAIGSPLPTSDALDGSLEGTYEQVPIVPKSCIKRYTAARQPPILPPDSITAILFDGAIMQPLLILVILFCFSTCLTVFPFQPFRFPHPPPSSYLWCVGGRVSEKTLV